jgi:hypothetical protein
MRIEGKNLMASKKIITGKEIILQAILDFVKFFVLRHGTVPKLEGRGSTVRLVRELNNFSKLYFVWSIDVKSNTNGALSPAGRENIQISYGPDKNSRSLVFSADYYGGTEKCKIHFFSEEPDWQKAFDHVAEIANMISQA